MAVLPQAIEAREHSPFIRAVLGPIADKVRPSDPLLEEAAVICARAVDLFDTDWAGALDLLRRSSAVGHVDSVFLLGAGLFRCAAFGVCATRAENEAMGLEGLGWLEHAMELGHQRAGDFFGEALLSLDEDMLAAWASLPARHMAVVH